MKKLYDAGVKVTFNTDNQSISNITLEDEYDHAINDLGFTYNDLILCNINSIECSFMPEEDKPASPKKLLITVIGFIIGCLISLGYSLICYKREEI